MRAPKATKNAPRSGGPRKKVAPRSRGPHGFSIQAAGAMVGLSKNSSYAAAAKGDIPTIDVGGLKIVPKTAWLKKLGIEPASAQADDDAA